MKPRKILRGKVLSFDPMQGTILKRFHSFIKRRKGGCMIWTGYKCKHGYGRFHVNGEVGKVLAHRAAVVINGELIKAYRDVHHRCKHKACVNANHLVQTTRKNHILLEAVDHEVIPF